MSLLTADMRDMIAGALREHASELRQVSPNRWEIELPGRRDAIVNAAIDDDWLAFNTESLWRASYWDLALDNARLDGGLKYALASDGETLRLRADIHLNADADIARRIRVVLEGLAEKRRPTGRGSSKPASAMPDLSALCEEAEWPFTARSGGRLAVELEARKAFFQAIIEPLPNGTALARAELAAWESLSEDCRKAVGGLLLSASEIVRMARGLATEEDGRITAAFEVAFPDRPSAQELRLALSALSVAARTCGREVKALGNETVAAQYLAVRGWSQ